MPLIRSLGKDIWNSRLYYNIYTCTINFGPSGTLGFAQQPSTNPGTGDACVLNAAEVGSTIFQGSTIAHETGHWLGLRHTFDTGLCTDEDMLDVHDTPTTKLDALQYVDKNNPCVNVINACNVRSMVRNNMDYNYEECLAYFTKGQAMVMRRYLTSPNFFRSTLTSSPALPVPASCLTYSCTNKECGDDGCGGVCGLCPSTQTCSASGTCVAALSNTACTAAQLIVPAKGIGLKVIGDLKGGTTLFKDCSKSFQSSTPFY